MSGDATSMRIAEDYAAYAGALAHTVRRLLRHPSDPVVTKCAAELLAQFDAGLPYEHGPAASAPGQDGCEGVPGTRSAVDGAGHVGPVVGLRVRQGVAQRGGRPVSRLRWHRWWHSEPDNATIEAAEPCPRCHGRGRLGGGPAASCVPARPPDTPRWYRIEATKRLYGADERLVTTDLTAAVHRLYDRLCMTVGPCPATRRAAEAAGWPPPLAWDDNQLDRPAGRAHGIRTAA